MAAALGLFFFTALSVNLILNLALGVKELAVREQKSLVQSCYPWLILFVSTALLWAFFARALAFTGGVFTYFLILPLAALGGLGLEQFLFYCLKKTTESARHTELFTGAADKPCKFSIGSPFSTLAAAALYLTIHFAVSFTDALILSLSFSAGGLLAYMILQEIQRRSELEAVPHGLRGTPILLISMGLLSLIFSATAALFLTVFLQGR